MSRPFSFWLLRGSWVASLRVKMMGNDATADPSASLRDDNQKSNGKNAMRIV
jgi:hypothetical protein